MNLYAAIVIPLIHLTGPDGQPIEVNPEAIVSLRPPRSTEHFAPGTHCLVHTADGKVITVKEECSSVKMLIQK